MCSLCFFFFKQKTAYEMRISDWSSDVCSSDLQAFRRALKVWQDVDDPFGVAQAQNDIGFAHYQLGNYNDAQVYLQQAADAYAKLGDHTEIGRASCRERVCHEV